MLLGHRRVRDLDKVDAVHVGLVVNLEMSDSQICRCSEWRDLSLSSNLFERLEDGLALCAVVVVEEDGDEGGGVEEALEHGAVDRLDLLVQLAVVVVDQPLEDRVLVAKVAFKGKRGGGKAVTSAG